MRLRYLLITRFWLAGFVYPFSPYRDGLHSGLWSRASLVESCLEL